MTDFHIFTESLKQKLQGPLPGADAQYKMAPEGRMPPELHAQYIQSAKKGGVLLLLYPRQGIPHFVLTLRHQYPGVHSGQVSFPGGKMEEGDRDLVETAIREAEEEIGISGSAVNVIGSLSELYIPPSNFLVKPVVGQLMGAPVFKAEESEVAKIIEAPLQELLHKDTASTAEIIIADTYKLQAPVFRMQGHTIWGATAMILNEFIQLVEDMQL